MVPPADFSTRLSATGAETGMCRYNVHAVNIIPCPLRGHEPPAELSAWISAASAETRMRRYNARSADIVL